MKLVIIVLMQLFCLNLFSQETKFSHKSIDNVTEEYYVLKENRKIKHGTYVKYESLFGKAFIIAAGSYENGQLHGSWEYYYRQEIPNPFLERSVLKEKGSYFQGKRNGLWFSYYQDSSAIVINKVESKEIDSLTINYEPRIFSVGMYINDKRFGEWKFYDYNGSLCQKYNYSNSKLVYDRTLTDSLSYSNHGPLYIGGQETLKKVFMDNFDKTSVFDNKLDVNNINLDGNSKSVKVIFSFVVSRNGKIEDLVINSDVNYASFKNEIKRLWSLTSDNWISGVFNNQPVNYPFQIKVIFTEYIHGQGVTALSKMTSTTFAAHSINIHSKSYDVKVIIEE